MSRRHAELALIGCALLPSCEGRGPTDSVPAYGEVRALVDRHCVPCHSAQPRIAAFPIAAGGLELDQASALRRHAALIKVRVVQDKSMPLLNKTGMTEAERSRLGRWIDAGAPLATGGEPP